ncbi:MAG: response regulator [Alphaproteobacteria bacterium]|jgi:CheY-like chemotaxis protein
MARILLAEDEPSVREFVQRALVHQGHQVTTVNDGGEALEALEDERFDLLLTDIVMPRVDGVALALKASKEYPHMRIVLMTGYAAERDRAHNLDALVHEVVSKPFTLSDICDTIDAALTETPSLEN